ncbi:carbonic anhydrase [Azospirillum sp. ST 5-10]|uniref:carbonic anhydrase n=1 Tax=unclassified Azospirillum TaxID=2630922 RepID=UPI003F4A1BD7
MTTERNPAIRRLLAGVKGFRARWYERNPESMRDLVEHGQHPDVLLIGCSDSRVDPALLTMAEPGELFVVRNVANLVPPYQPDGSYHGTSAAIEYAVTVLQVGTILVLGHAQCGGIAGLIRIRSGETVGGDFVAPWVNLASEACDRFVGEVAIDGDGADASIQTLVARPGLAERAAVRGSVENLMTFPWIRERVEAGTLQVHGWWFDLESGDLWAIDQATKRFERVVE